MPIKFKTKLNSQSVEKWKSPNEAPHSQPAVKITDFPQNWLIYHVHKNTGGLRPARHHNRVHISDLDPARKWCPRECALLTIHGETRPPVFISTAQRTTFNMGYRGSDMFRDMIPPEMVWGHWRCRNCKQTEKNTYTPAKCASCGVKGSLEYREVLLRDPKTGITGSVDLIVDLLGNGILTIVETKTEGGDTFRKRAWADFDHEWRTKGYMWLASVSDTVAGYRFNLETARIVYINKSGHEETPKLKQWGLKDGDRSPFKEYMINRDDSFLEGQLAKLRAYRKWRNVFDDTKGAYCAPLPDRVCSTANDSRASGCPVCKKCFKPS